MNALPNILHNGATEIRSLRRENEILRAKVEVMDIFAAALFSRPPNTSQGFGVDVAWQMDHAAEQLVADDAEKAAADAAKAGA